MHHAAPAPEFGDFPDRQMVVEVIAHPWGGFGVMADRTRIDVRILEDIEALGQGRHHAVFHAIMDHLDEVSGAGRAAMEVAVFRRAAGFFPSRRAGQIAAPGSDRLEDRVEVLHGTLLAPDHQTVAALESPYPAARAAIDVVNAQRGEFFGPAAVIAKVGIPAVDDDVIFPEVRDEVFDHPVGDRGGDHDPRGAWFLQQRGEFLERTGTGCAVLDQFGYRIRVGVIDDAGVSVLHQAPHDIGAHPAESDHSELHKLQFFGPA